LKSSVSGVTLHSGTLALFPHSTLQRNSFVTTVVQINRDFFEVKRDLGVPDSSEHPYDWKC
jgi:hypothetical protein